MARLGKGEQRQANFARAFEAYVEGAEARASAVAAARRRATQTAIELEGLRATGYALGTIVGFGDRDVGRALGGVFDAGVNFAAAVNRFQFNLVSGATPFAANAILAGDLLSMGMGVMSALGVGGPAEMS